MSMVSPAPQNHGMSISERFPLPLLATAAFFQSGGGRVYVKTVCMDSIEEGDWYSRCIAFEACTIYTWGFILIFPSRRHVPRPVLICTRHKYLTCYWLSTACQASFGCERGHRNKNGAAKLWANTCCGKHA